jgi:hypothetical protein
MIILLRIERDREMSTLSSTTGSAGFVSKKPGRNSSMHSCTLGWSLWSSDNTSETNSYTRKIINNNK